MPLGDPPEEDDRLADGRSVGDARRTSQDEEGRRDGSSRDPVSHQVLPLAQEQVVVHRRQIETGRVRVSTKVGTRQEEIEVDLTKDEVEVRRVPVGREVDGPVQIRQEGDVTIVPVLEEVLVVRKQLILREEVHIRRQSRSRSETRSVELQYEEPLIERLPVEEDADQ